MGRLGSYDIMINLFLTGMFYNVWIIRKHISFPGNVPELPKAYSTDIKINFINKEYTVEMKYAKNNKGKKQLMEFKKNNRHVKYIIRGDEESTLYIEYQNNSKFKRHFFYD